MESNVSVCVALKAEVTPKIKQLEVKEGHVPRQCPIAGNANVGEKIIVRSRPIRI